MWEVGFLYYQQEEGITTVSKFSPLPETRLVSRFYPKIAAPPVSHHLIQRLPERLFSHSRVEFVNPTKVLWHKKRRVSTPSFNVYASETLALRCELMLMLDATIH